MQVFKWKDEGIQPIEGFNLIYNKILKYYEKFKNSKEVQVYPKCGKSYQKLFIYR